MKKPLKIKKPTKPHFVSNWNSNFLHFYTFHQWVVEIFLGLEQNEQNKTKIIDKCSSFHLQDSGKIYSAGNWNWFKGGFSSSMIWDCKKQWRIPMIERETSWILMCKGKQKGWGERSRENIGGFDGLDSQSIFYILHCFQT